MPIKSVMPKPRKVVDTSTYTGRFAVRLRSLREKRGMSVEEFAENLGLSAITVYQWEQGKHAPSFDKIPEIAEFFGFKRTRDVLPER